MFSRLYKSARAVFTDLDDTKTIQSTPPAPLAREETMVTTRHRGSQASAGDSLEDEESINVYVPTSSSKRQRRGAKRSSSSEEDEADYAPPSSRKRKRLPVRAKDVESPEPGKTRPVVEISVKKMSPEPDHRYTGGVEEGEGEEEKEEEEDVNVNNKEQDTETAEPIVPKKHLRFGSEEGDDEYFSTARDVVVDEDIPRIVEDPRMIQDSDESEGDAPEAVGIQEAAESVKLKDEEAARALKHHLSASRKKRKDRNEVLKKQAESSKKRKLEDGLINHTKKAKHSTKGDNVPSTKEDRNPNENESYVVAEEIVIQNDVTKPMPLSSKRALPDILPAEYLVDAKPEDILPFDQFPIKKAKRTKFHFSTEKEPKDRRVGSTTYRVTKASSTNLAPKSSSQARNMKDSWLQGRSGKKIGTDRISFAKGFFKK
ncbi:hypothetical protein N431DRAFT_486905 [Stipitochalara longipes BDJ]|nr:hypothetical protein N431DRAFT_486905 [Stipitochalara longipes BDJ]